MTDFHDNIFYYYRGSRESPDQHYQQLEDNTTKALANTLQHCSPAIALKFLEWLGIGATGPVAVQLQRATIGRERIRRASQRLLLGLVPTRPDRTDSMPTDHEQSHGGDSRPDAWLYGEDFVVLIESKVGAASLNPVQMEKHRQKLLLGARHQPRCEVRTWHEVHQFFVTCSRELHGRDKWLTEQFKQYLEWQGMSDFVGFEEWMFEFLVRQERDSDEAALMRRTMECFGERVLNGGLKRLAPAFYEEPWVGKLSAEDDHFWVAFGPAGGPKVFGRMAHQTISLDEFGLEVFVNVELLPAITKLRKKIRADKQRFIRLISRLPGPFRVAVVERQMRPDRPRMSDNYDIATLEGGICQSDRRSPYGLKCPTTSTFDYLIRLLEEIPLPYLSVRRRIDRKHVLALSKRGEKVLVADVVKTMKAFHPLVEFINK